METGYRPVNEMILPFFESDRRREIDEIGPQVLTLDHLGLGFLVCLIPLVLAGTVFCAEVIFKATKILFLKQNRNWIDIHSYVLPVISEVKMVYEIILDWFQFAWQPHHLQRCSIHRWLLWYLTWSALHLDLVLSSLARKAIILNLDGFILLFWVYRRWIYFNLLGFLEKFAKNPIFLPFWLKGDGLPKFSPFLKTFNGKVKQLLTKDLSTNWTKNCHLARKRLWGYWPSSFDNGTSLVRILGVLDSFRTSNSYFFHGNCCNRDFFKMFAKLMGQQSK